MSWRILALQVLTVHVLKSLWNNGTYSTRSGGLLKHRYLQYMFWMILPTRVLIENVLEDYWIVATEVLTVKCTCPGWFSHQRYLQYKSYRILAHKYIQCMSWMILATQVLTAHVLEDSFNRGGFLQHMYLQYMSWGRIGKKSVKSFPSHLY